MQVPFRVLANSNFLLILSGHRSAAEASVQLVLHQEYFSKLQFLYIMVATVMLLRTMIAVVMLVRTMVYCKDDFKGPCHHPP